MIDGETIKLLLDIGGQGVLLFLLFQVWGRLNVVTDILIKDRMEASEQRAELLAEVKAQGLGQAQDRKRKGYPYDLN